MQKVTFIQESISKKDEKGQATKDSKYYAMVRVVTMVEQDGFEFAAEEFNAVVLSTPETLNKLKELGKGYELPFNMKARQMVVPSTGELVPDFAIGYIVKAYIITKRKDETKTEAES